MNENQTNKHATNKHTHFVKNTTSLLFNKGDNSFKITGLHAKAERAATMKSIQGNED